MFSSPGKQKFAYYFYYVYRFFTIISYPILYLHLKVRIKKGKEHPERWREKLGFYNTPKLNGKLIWINAASVGELNSCILLAEILSEKAMVLMTTGTLTSGKVFENIINEKPHLKGKIIHAFAPLDSIYIVKRFLNFFNPQISCFIDSEFWPNLIHESSKISPVFSINTRISSKSLKRWFKVPVIFTWILSHFKFIFPYTKSLSMELSKFGMKNIIYFGNLKYDCNFDLKEEKINSLKEMFQKKKVICFASTHGIEEEKLLPIIKSLSEKEGLMQIIIPRHPHRGQEIKSLIESAGIKCVLRSQNEIPLKNEIYIADTIGEIPLFYSISNIIFIGGSLINIGGHNILEAAFFSKPIIVGEFYHNFHEIVDEMLSENALIVSNENNLLKEILSILENDNGLGERAKKVTLKYKGISASIAKIILNNT